MVTANPGDAMSMADFIRTIAKATSVEVLTRRSFIDNDLPRGVCVIVNGGQIIDATPKEGVSVDQLAENLGRLVREIRALARQHGFDPASISA